MDIVKCKRCGERLDKRTDEFVKLSSGYSHKKCEDAFQIKKNTVICQVCRQGINKLTDDFVKRNNGYVHKSCITEDEMDKLELCNYISEIFHLKSPGPANLSMIKKYHTENNYSYKSMYYALKYYFEIQHGSVEKAHERIGILPYIYDDAKKYYKKLESEQNSILINVGKQLTKEESTVVIKVAPKTKNRTINLEDLA